MPIITYRWLVASFVLAFAIPDSTYAQGRIVRFQQCVENARGFSDSEVWTSIREYFEGLGTTPSSKSQLLKLHSLLIDIAIAKEGIAEIVDTHLKGAIGGAPAAAAIGSESQLPALLASIKTASRRLEKMADGGDAIAAQPVFRELRQLLQGKRVGTLCSLTAQAGLGLVNANRVREIRDDLRLELEQLLKADAALAEYIRKL